MVTLTPARTFWPETTPPPSLAAGGWLLVGLVATARTVTGAEVCERPVFVVATASRLMSALRLGTGKGALKTVPFLAGTGTGASAALRPSGLPVALVSGLPFPS